MANQDPKSVKDRLVEEVKTYKYVIAVTLMSILVFSVFFLPEIQTTLYVLLVASPSLVQWSVVSLVILGVGVYKDNSYIMVGALVVFVGMGLFIGPFVGNIQAHEEQADRIESQETLQADNLPETTEQHLRVVPRGVSDTYADSSMQKSQYGLSDSDIAYQDGKYQWSYGVVPDNFFVQLRGNQFGSLYVDMEQTSKSVTLDESQFENGRGQLWFDSYEYQSVLNNPTSLHVWETTFNTKDYIAHSTISHDWEFRLLPIPQFYAIPQHETVEVMDTDGTVSSLSPEEAQASDRLDKQNFYPYDVAMFKVNSMRYKNGVINLWTTKEDVFEVAGLPSSSQNNWPLTVPTKDGDDFGLTYFVGTEAVNSGSGLYQVWLVDGQTGETSYVQYDENQIGPARSVEFVSNKQQVNELSDATPVSPIPVVSDEQLYWHVKVVPQSETGIIYTAFVNADTGDVTLLEGTEPIYQFMTEDEVEQIQSGQDSGESSGATTQVTVAVTDESGEIIRTEEVSIPEGGEADITVNNPTEEEAE